MHTVSGTQKPGAEAMTLSHPLAFMNEPAESHPSLDAELCGYRAQFLSARKTAAALTADLSDAQVNWRAAPGRWSIAQCLAHLNIVGKQYRKSIRELVDYGRRRRMLTSGTHHHGFWGGLFVKLMEPPVRIRLPAPRYFLPEQHYTVAQVAPAFLSLQEEYLRLIEEANGLDLGALRIRNPLFRPLRLSLGQCFGLVAGHERRHVWQAERIRTARDFPRG